MNLMLTETFNRLYQDAMGRMRYKSELPEAGKGRKMSAPLLSVEVPVLAAGSVKTARRASVGRRTLYRCTSRPTLRLHHSP